MAQGNEIALWHGKSNSHRLGFFGLTTRRERSADHSALFTPTGLFQQKGCPRRREDAEVLSRRFSNLLAENAHALQQ